MLNNLEQEKYKEENYNRILSALIKNLDFSLIVISQGHEIILSIDISDVDLCLGIKALAKRVELIGYLKQNQLRINCIHFRKRYASKRIKRNNYTGTIVVKTKKLKK